MSTETLPECEVEVPDMDYSNFERTTLASKNIYIYIYI